MKKRWKPTKCKTCDNFIEKCSWSPTGWTHVGHWEGIRCQGNITGAQPAK